MASFGRVLLGMMAFTVLISVSADPDMLQDLCAADLTSRMYSFNYKNSHFRIYRRNSLFDSFVEILA